MQEVGGSGDGGCMRREGVGPMPATVLVLAQRELCGAQPKTSTPYLQT